MIKGTATGTVVQSGRRPDCESGDCEFKSHPSPIKRNLKIERSNNVRFI